MGYTPPMSLSRSIPRLPPPLASLTSFWLVALFALVPVGCASTHTFLMPERTPDDFVLAATVFVGSASEHANPTEIPARYIVEPDATFRASVGPGSSPTTYPQPTRTLAPTDLDRLWALVRALDLTNANEGVRPIASPEIFHAPGDQTVYLIEVRSNRVQRAFALDPGIPQARALIEHLAALAWVQSD